MVAPRRTEHRPGTTILQTARQMGMSPPFSCEAGSCATCMARLVEGTASMHVNNALTADEVDEGWVLTCQAGADQPPGACDLRLRGGMMDAAAHRRRHRARAAAGPLRRRHDQGRRRGGDGGVHLRRHLQRLRRHVPAGRLPRCWWRPPPRGCSWSGRRCSSSTATRAPASSRCASSTRRPTTCASATTPTPTGGRPTDGGCAPGR